MRKEDVEDEFNRYLDMEKINLTIARRLNNARLDANLSVASLSRLSGVDSAHINRVEMGKKNLSFNAGIRLCKALNINLNDLYKVGEDEEDSIANRLGKIQDIIHTLPKDEFDEVLNAIQDTVNRLHSNKI